MISKLQKPRFILFDYGETLAHEDDFLPGLGFAAMLKYARKNPENADADTLLSAFSGCYRQLRLHAHEAGVEIPNLLRWRWLFEMYGLEFSISGTELETVFWNAAAPCVPTPGIRDVLSLLRQNGIGSGVVSNMGFSSAALKHRLDGLFPEHSFHFVLTSADYGLRKPNPHLFNLAVRKSGLPAGDIWFAGDNPAMDIAGAAGAGLTAVYYDRDLGCSYREIPPAELDVSCIRIHDWSELCTLILA